MVPASKDSTLAKRLKEVVVKNPGPKGTVVKVIEKPGRPVMSGLRANPLSNSECYREDSPIVRAGEDCRNRCIIQNILYTATRVMINRKTKVFSQNLSQSQSI